MIREIPNFGVPGDTMVAVVLGALLATLGGFLAARLEAWLRRREREEDAALLLGEIVFTFCIVLKMAAESRAVGDPYGPITLQMLHGARREADVYARYRERLPDLRDGTLRIDVHKLMLTLTMTLEGLLESHARIAALPNTPAGKAAASAIGPARDSAFDFIVETVPRLDPLLTRLAVLARASFDQHEATARA